MQKTGDYWRKRFELLENASHRKGLKISKDISTIFAKTKNKIDKEINDWYIRFAINNSVGMATARKLLTARELREFKWSVEEYIQHAKNAKWEKALNNILARYNISRLEAIKLSLQHYIEVALDKELEELTKSTKDVYTGNYYTSAYELQRGTGVGVKMAELDEGLLDKILSKPWTSDNMTFSSRIWSHKNKLISTLHMRLTQNVIMGKPPHELINDVAKMFNTAKHNASRLVMTEIAYFHTASSRDAFKELGVEQYQFNAVLDNKTSELCGSMDGQIIALEDLQIGVNAPPLHPHCRSVIVPYYDDYGVGERAARGKDGKTYFVPASMTYREWEATMVD